MKRELIDTGNLTYPCLSYFVHHITSEWSKYIGQNLHRVCPMFHYPSLYDTVFFRSVAHSLLYRMIVLPSFSSLIIYFPHIVESHSFAYHHTFTSSIDNKMNFFGFPFTSRMSTRSCTPFLQSPSLLHPLGHVTVHELILDQR
jgi:hypothetical protein